jgi:hypothetical protein
VSEHVGEIDPDRFLVLLEEIRAARENMGKYTRKTSQEYEDSTIVKTRDYRDSLIRLMQEVLVLMLMLLLRTYMSVMKVLFKLVKQLRMV